MRVFVEHSEIAVPVLESTIGLAKCPQKNRRHDRLEGDSSITITVVEDVRIEDCAIRQ